MSRSPSRGHRRGRAAVVAVAGLLAVAAVLLWRGRGRRPPSVLIVSVDTLRADHLSSYGYGRATSPAIDRLAAQGARFEQAVTPRPKTTPSLVSMLTGHYPHRHGIRTNFAALPGVGLLPDAAGGLRPDPEAPPTLAERAAAAGLRTAGFVSNLVLTEPLSGLQRGFEVYDDELTSTEVNRPHVRERKAGENTDRALRWLEEAGDEPFFLWVHYIDPHGSYSAPEEYRGRFEGGARPDLPERVPLAAADRSRVHVDETGRRIFVAGHNLWPDRENPSELVADHVDAYDEEILYVDTEIGRLLDGLDRLGRADDTLVVFTSDHGESFGEHSYYFEHGHYVYDPSARVPLVLRGPGVAPGTVVREQATLLDVVPTVLDALEVPGERDLPGRTLLPAARGEPAPAGRVAFLERRDYGFDLRAARTNDWKLVFNYRVPGSWPLPAVRELYDLRADPREERNLYGDGDGDGAAAADAARARLEGELREWVRSAGDMRSYEGEDAKAVALLGEAEREGLQALGYADAGGAGDGDRPATRDEDFRPREAPETDDPRELVAWALGGAPAQRALAVDALARWGGLTDDALLAYLGPDHPPVVRARAAERLGARGDAAAVPALERALARAPTAGVALACAGALERLGAPPADDVVGSGLAHLSAGVRAAAAWWAGELGDAGRRGALEALRDDPVPEVRAFALRALARLGDDGAVDGLRALVATPERAPGTTSSPDASALRAAVLALAELGRFDVVAPLAPGLGADDQAGVRYALLTGAARADAGDAARALREVPALPTAAAVRLVQAAAQPDRPGVRRLLAGVFRNAGLDPDVRVAAAVGLMRVDAAAPR